MIWVAWFTLALESLVIAPSLWIMWVLISEASRAPDDPLSPEERPPHCVRPRGSRRAGLCEQQEAPHGLRGGRLPGSFRGQDRRRETFSQRAAVRLGLCRRSGGGEGPRARRVQHSPKGRYRRRR